MHTNVRYVGIDLVPYNILFIILYSSYYCSLLSLLLSFTLLINSL